MKTQTYHKATKALFDAAKPKPNLARIDVLALCFSGNGIYLTHDRGTFQVYEPETDGYHLIPFDDSTKVKFLSGCANDVPENAS